MSNENEVVIHPESIRWNIKPLVREAEDGVMVELQWGWTAGMTEEDLKNYAEDAPTGYDSVTTTLDLAEELRDQLNVIIEQHKVRHEELRAASDRKMQEMFPDLDEMLEAYMKRKLP